MAVVDEIIAWAKRLPLWQQEAIRLILLKDALSEKDIKRLSNLCKEKDNIIPHKEIVKIKPVDKSVFPSSGGTTSEDVRLLSIGNPENVNALDSRSIIEFKPDGLTIVYGENGAGKSGYCRIIKVASRSRGQNKGVLPNAYMGSSTTPQADITYSVGNKSPKKFRWIKDKSINDELASISFFVSDCAEQYIQRKNDVAYIPFGLDLFDKLSQVVDLVKDKIKSDGDDVDIGKIATPITYPGTKVGDLLLQAENNTKAIDDLTKLAKITPSEKNRIKELNRNIALYDEEEKGNQIQILEAKLLRLNKLKTHTNKLESTLSKSEVEGIGKSGKELDTVNEALAILEKETFKEGLPGIGSNPWMELWNAAKKYSETHVHVSEKFPYTGKGAVCVLCFQPISDAAADRFIKFQEYVETDLKEKQAKLNRELKEKTDIISILEVEPEEWESLKKEIAKDVSKEIDKYFERTKKLKEDIKNKTAESKYNIKFKALSAPIKSLDKEIERITKKRDEISKKLSEKELSNAKEELQELLARGALKGLASILNHNKQSITLSESLIKCSNKINTSRITRKGSELTEKNITKKLRDNFENELSELGVKNIKVKLDRKEGRKGVVYHEIRISKSSNPITVSEIASDGEQRSIAIAGFLSELSTAQHQSAIVFDDPVSSQDHENRENIAHRLAVESKKRQVIIFTHDMFFVMLLQEHAKQAGLSSSCFEITKMGDTAGIHTGDEPWLAQKTIQRFPYLQRKCADAKSLYDAKKPSEYISAARELYGKIRETLERAAEEIMLNSVVRRFYKAVHITQLVEVKKEDILTTQKLYDKASKLFTGHDTSPQATSSFPKPDEIKKDIDEIIALVKKINSQN